YGGEVDFRRNQILSNTAYLTGTTGGDYGGMYTYLSNAGLLTMMDNVITGNEAQGNFGGLSAELYSGSRLVMAHNLISANTAITNGAGIYIKGDDDSQYFLERNRVLNNTAAYQSAGVIIDNDDLTEPLWGWSVNNLVADNSGGSQLEAGIYVDSADFRSLNDTIANNGQYGIWMTGTLTSTAYVSNTIIWDHILSFDSAHPTTQTMEADYSDIQLTLGNWPGMANLNTDPLFLGGDDYHLQGTSPVMDQADAAVAPARDLDAIPRPVGAGVDMGCYEYHLSGVTLTGDGLLSGDPGTWVTHTLTLTNDGDAEDAFALSLSGNVWPAHLPADHVTLAAGADTTVVVAVRVPAGASAGESDTVTVDAVSTRNALV
ncbi:MAG: right-handed parallel beta-helix repeat-containing protein, partial [Deltaproteobacteria bacterium]|nr:right-handed parallel beta-helix repeat-containing protein [Candidatus Anaeroferrophillacea bacterium]